MRKLRVPRIRPAAPQGACSVMCGRAQSRPQAPYKPFSQLVPWQHLSLYLPPRIPPWTCATLSTTGIPSREGRSPWKGPCFLCHRHDQFAGISMRRWEPSTQRLHSGQNLGKPPMKSSVGSGPQTQAKACLALRLPAVLLCTSSSAFLLPKVKDKTPQEHQRVQSTLLNLPGGGEAVWVSPLPAKHPPTSSLSSWSVMCCD